MWCAFYNTIIWLSEGNAGKLVTGVLTNGISENPTAGPAYTSPPSSAGLCDGGMHWEWELISTAAILSHRGGRHNEPFPVCGVAHSSGGAALLTSCHSCSSQRLTLREDSRDLSTDTRDARRQYSSVFLSDLFLSGSVRLDNVEMKSYKL